MCLLFSNRFVCEFFEDLHLEKIQYPSGGMDEFTYETNQFILRDSLYYGGGVRVKQIKTKESALKTAKIRNYTYNDGNSCSGKIVNFPLFAQYRNHHSYDTTVAYLTSTYEVRQFSNSITGLETTQGSLVGYTDVQIDYDGNGREEYEYSMPGTFGEHQAVWHEASSEYIYERSEANVSTDPYDINRTYSYKDYFPFPPDPDLDWMRGQLLSKKVYNEDNYPVKYFKNTYEIGHYTKSRAQIAVTESYYSDDGSQNYCIHSKRYRNEYSLLTGWSYLSQSEVFTFNPDDSSEYVYESSFYDYNDDQLLTEKQVLNSNGDTLNTFYTYSSDEGTAPYLSMTSDFNMLNYPTKTEYYNESTFLQSNSTTYKEWDTDLFAPEYRKQKVGTTEYTQLQFHDYDDKMNVLSISKKNDIKQSFVWGYNQVYPIALVQNAAEDEIFHTSFEENDGTASSSSKTGEYIHILSGAFQVDKTFTSGTYVMSYYWRSNASSAWVLQEEPFTYTSGNITTTKTSGQIDELRVYPSDALMTTYTYDPLIGLTSQTDANNQTTYYEYDSFGRLKSIKDSDDNLLQKTDYHFATQ